MILDLTAYLSWCGYWLLMTAFVAGAFAEIEKDE